MNATLAQLTEQALALSSDERARLVDRLMKSLDPAADEEIQALWVAEATRRRDEIRSGAVKPIDGDTALERVRRRVTR